MIVRIKRERDDSIPPKYATDGAAGFDLYAAKDVFIEPGETEIVPTGWAFEIPRGYEMQIRPRSGITVKTKLRTQLGTVDTDYRGEVGVIVDNVETGEEEAAFVFPMFEERCGIRFSDGVYIIRKGDRIAQGVLAPVERADFEISEELTVTKRGAGGYGSTGTNDEREDE